ncbi:ArsR/SmtB family transcription factor [Paenibacillus apiarius]|uniref:Metalloregulator ArsR/SmtB family transcription factor n=1 Tax=Paenibacillus apiarius TaxID=46240 RepID=A0ABT4DQA9_9BACL|nr:metalloregulator ArsR/SmtB family transcription factor [Paenibacillus apiarius]MBN3524207.1 winged helix-turn-helix transcriptional regulator [Paenibacillus apiarius]MCY9513992.1 metalloregulator ArsR/SmtB family transcription factor [Paenibacillus apiarius]MCY9519509.1 metalloregulator ArsR/SmtB family transcription factor [Paenibacillus apiarius]MCY9552436.1 metalloregulator ArsR/SmtB family transcription factor [Paenibacillus apiarius]MCY9556265.1 metalloregulator ArsR/SmtB family transc
MTAPLPKHDVFQAIADPTRRQLLELLGEQEMPVTVISGHFPMSRTAVSKHLRILADAGLVKGRKVGRETRYSLDPEPLLELKRWLAYYERYWDNKLSMLKHLVEADEPIGAAAFPPLAVIDRETTD